MTVAVTEALADGRAGRALRVHRQHLGLGRRLRRPRGPDLRRSRPAGQDRAGQAGPGGRARREDPADRRQLRRLPRAGPQDRRRLPGRPPLVELGEPDPDRRPGERRVRGRATSWAARPTCTACRSATPATSPRTGRATAPTTRTALIPELPADVRLPGGRRGAAGARRAGRAPGDHRHRDPDRRARRPGPAAITAREESGGLFAAVTDDEILDAYRLLSAREAVFVEPASAASVAGLLAGQPRRAQLPPQSLVVCTVTGHGLKDPDTALLAAPRPVVVPVDPGAVAAALASSLLTAGCRIGADREVRVRVPASSANLGPGFDTLGLALRPLRRGRGHRDGRRRPASSRCTGEGAGEVPLDERHLVVRAMRADLRAASARRRRGCGCAAATRSRTVAGLGRRPPRLGGRRGGRRARCSAATWSRPGALLQVAAVWTATRDNAAASLLGGFVVAWKYPGNNGDGYGAARLEPACGACGRWP